MQINPVLIGIVNALLPGLGYLVIKERIVFGWLILVSTLLGLLLMFVEPSGDTLFISITQTGKWIEGIIYLLAMFAFGYDVYELARVRQELSAQVPEVGSLS